MNKPYVARNPAPGLPLFETPYFEDPGSTGRLSYGEIASSLRDEGFAVIDFPEPEIEVLASNIKRELSGHFELDAWSVAKREGDAIDLRIQDAHKFCDPVKQIAVNSEIIDLLSAIYGRQAFPFQTLNFPVGTEQHFHSDTVHFSCLPQGFMCGVWLALEDIGEDQGPLLYYPGSHKLPLWENYHIGRSLKKGDQFKGQELFHEVWEDVVAHYGLEPRTLPLKKGQAIIWAANLLHGGSEHLDATKTRWSQVTHFYFEDCCYYTPLMSDVIQGNIDYREPTDITSGRKVQNMCLGQKVKVGRIGRKSRVRRWLNPKRYSPKRIREQLFR